MRTINVECRLCDEEWSIEWDETSHCPCCGSKDTLINGNWVENLIEDARDKQIQELKEENERLLLILNGYGYGES